MMMFSQLKLQEHAKFSSFFAKARRKKTRRTESDNEKQQNGKRHLKSSACQMQSLMSVARLDTQIFVHF